MPNDGTGDAAAAPQPGPAPLGLLHPACSSAASRSAVHRLCSPRGFCLSRCPAPLGAPQPDLPVPQRTGGSCSSPAPHPGVAKPPPAAVLRPSSKKRAAGRSRPPSAPCAAVPGRTAGLPRAMGAAHTRGTAGRAARCRTRALRKHPALPGIPALSVPPRCRAGTQRFPPPGSGERLRRVPADGSAVAAPAVRVWGTARDEGPLRSSRRPPSAAPTERRRAARGPPGPARFPAPSGAVRLPLRPTRDALRPPLPAPLGRCL